MYIRIQKSYRSVVALCDSELLGKKFEEGNRQLDVRENFYKGEEISKEEALKILQKQADEDATFNIVGKESIQVAIDAGIIAREDVDYIQSIPFSLILV